MTVSQSSSSINSSLSHRSCFVAALAPDRTQRRGWPHTAVQQDCHTAARSPYHARRGSRTPSRVSAHH